jgi:hypothetical protein
MPSEIGLSLLLFGLGAAFVLFLALVVGWHAIGEALADRRMNGNRSMKKRAGNRVQRAAIARLTKVMAEQRSAIRL